MEFKHWLKRKSNLSRVVQSRLRPEARILSEGEEGQGLIEAAVGFVFLLLILLAMFEMAIVFASYIALLNCSIQGAVYAAAYPRYHMVEGPLEPDDPHYSYYQFYQEYESIIRSEALAGGLSLDSLHISPPQLPSGTLQGEVLSGNTPITVTLEYHMTTFSSEIIFPLFDRFGLPSEYHISARSAVPSRGEP
jgi:hypothetical protein